MALSIDAELILAAGLEEIVGQCRLDFEFVSLANFVGDVSQFEPTDAGNRAGEVAVDQFAAKTDGLEDLCTTVRLDRRDAHLRADLQQPLADRLDVALAGFPEIEVAELARLVQFSQ